VVIATNGNVVFIGIVSISIVKYFTRGVRKDMVAPSFRILIHRSSESLHLKLLGDFDGGSASLLANTIARYRFGASKIFVHTSGLNSVHPDAADELGTYLQFDASILDSLVFTGEKAATLAPVRFKQAAL